jgi:hypothetical protein
MDKSFIRISTTLVLYLLLMSSDGVCQEGKNQKFARLMENAEQFYQDGKWDDCAGELHKAIGIDSLIAGPYLMLGDLMMDTGYPDDAVYYYKKALELDPEKKETACMILANALFSSERYTEASEYYEKLLSWPDTETKLKNSASSKLFLSKFRESLMRNPVAYSPVNIGPDINSGADEYINAISADGREIYFTRKITVRSGQNKKFAEDLFYAVIGDDTLKKAGILSYPPGKEGDAGSVCIAPDGRSLFFTACFRSDSYGSCDLYYSEKNGMHWNPAKNMGSVVNSGAWEAQPSISPDGNSLYFASNRNGGLGSSDIWKTEKDTNGNWGQPVNLGKPVNGAEAEMAPFLHFDNQTLYFSSSSHPGMGGADLFKAVRQGKSWGDPANIGYPVNTAADELVIIVNAGADKGFISSNSLKGLGGYDIYSFELAESIRPVAVTYLKGKVFDRKTSLPLQADFELIDTAIDSIIVRSVSDKESGEFLVCIPVNRNYALHVSSPGYLFYSEYFPLNEVKDNIDPVLKNLPLDPVAAGNSMILRNIFFDKDQYQIKQESFAELERLIIFMEDNPELKIEIGGHTDSDGSEMYNLELSQNRAKAVYNYLISNGLDPARLTFRGYGEEMPCGSNDTEEGKAGNRRTQITIL